MNNLKNYIIITLIALIALIATLYLISFFSTSQPVFEGSCEKQYLYKTGINFIVPNSTFSIMSAEEISLKLIDFISYSNNVLSNSCIPLSRFIKSINFIDDSRFFPLDIYALRSWLEHSNSSYFPNKKTNYTVVLYSSDSTSLKDTCGEADMYNRNFVMVSIDCPRYVLEHELGHTMLAQHPKTQFLTENNLKESTYLLEGTFNKYSFGFTCAKHGSIMTYEPEYLRVPIYSSPLIIFKGEHCGKQDEADNRRQVLNWIKESF